MRLRPSSAARVAVILLVLLASGCARGADRPAPDVDRPPVSTDTRVGKVLVVVVENHSLAQMQAQMPYLRALASAYAYADHYEALAHPSLPNYLAIVGGTTSGVTDDGLPQAHARHGPSVFGQAIGAGRTATVYADGMPEPCSLENGGDGYVARHNTWTYQHDERELCARHDLPLTGFADDVAAGDLPEVGMLIPDQCHNAHDCPLAVADDWLRGQLDLVFAGPDWASGHLAVVVTADEDERSASGGEADNRVLTVVAHPALDGVVVHDELSHLSLSRALSEMSGSPPLADAADAPSLWTAFGLRPVQ